MRRCYVCGNPIPAARLEALPNATTCVFHSMERKLAEDEVELDGTSSEECAKSVSNVERSDAT